MYKDPDKQREADRERQRRYRANRGLKAYPKGVTNSGGDKQGVTVSQESMVIPEHPVPVIPKHRGFTQGKQVPILDGPKKRGKDIKCFEDLPADVQQSIDMMSMVNGRIDQTIKVNRTAIAVHYQHLFPDRYHSTGIAI